MTAVLESSPIVEVEYVSIVGIETLADLDTIEASALIAVAARVGATRLIDNLIVDLNDGQASV
jgi:pantoate--beta-alanine ligase